MPVREMFHLIHIVDDFDAAEAFFADLLAPQTTIPKHWSDFDKRFASLGRIGSDFVLELMEPSKAEEDRKSPVPSFQARFGQHAHSMAWYVDEADMPALVERLETEVRVLNPYAALVPPEGRSIPRVVFTHPRDTFGQIELMGIPPEGAMNDPLFQPGWTDAPWRDGPLGILRTSHVTSIVGDLDRGTQVYGLLGGAAFHRATDAVAERVYVMVGNQTVMELARPLSTESRLGQDQARNGDLFHGVTFAVRDLEAVERHADKLGVTIAERGAEAITLDPSDCWDLVVSFTTAPIPGDPRGAPA